MKSYSLSLLRRTLVAAGVGFFASAFAASAATGPMPQKQQVVFDVDLTQGSAGSGKVTGGQWDGGWRVTDQHQRIVWDPGRPIANGILEVSFTTKAAPPTDKKINFAGVHEFAHLNQNEVEQLGDIFYARTGQPNIFGKAKVFVRKWDHTEFEKSVGSSADWKTDDRTVMTVRFEWNDSDAVFTSPSGAKLECRKPFFGLSSKAVLDNLRYVFVGSDRYNGFTPVGVRFTRVKLIELTPAR